jgi:hypothetical protein
MHPTEGAPRPSGPRCGPPAAPWWKPAARPAAAATPAAPRAPPRARCARCPAPARRAVTRREGRSFGEGAARLGEEPAYLMSGRLGSKAGSQRAQCALFRVPRSGRHPALGGAPSVLACCRTCFSALASSTAAASCCTASWCSLLAWVCARARGSDCSQPSARRQWPRAAAAARARRAPSSACTRARAPRPRPGCGTCRSAPQAATPSSATWPAAP